MDEEDEDIQKALHYAIGKISQTLVEEEEGDITAKVQLSPDAIAALTELTFQFATTSLARDIVSFSAHANRSIASAKDVRLVLRKAPLRICEEFDKLCEEKCSTGSSKATHGTTTGSNKPFSMDAPKKPARKNINKNKDQLTSTKYSEDEDSDIDILSSTQKKTRFLDTSPLNKSSSSSGEDDFSDNMTEREQANKKEKPEWKKSTHTTSYLDIESSSSDEAEFLLVDDFRQEETDDLSIGIDESKNTNVECIDLSGDY